MVVMAAKKKGKRKSPWLTRNQTDLHYLTVVSIAALRHESLLFGLLVFCIGLRHRCTLASSSRLHQLRLYLLKVGSHLLLDLCFLHVILKCFGYTTAANTWDRLPLASRRVYGLQAALLSRRALAHFVRFPPATNFLLKREMLFQLLELLNKLQELRFTVCSGEHLTGAYQIFSLHDSPKHCKIIQQIVNYKPQIDTAYD